MVELVVASVVCGVVAVVGLVTMVFVCAVLSRVALTATLEAEYADSKLVMTTKIGS